MKEKGKEPRIIILDIDGTFFGNVNNYVDRWYVLEYIKARKMVGSDRLSVSFPESSRLVRPGFIDFIKELGPKCEFFIYTAGASEWVNYIIPIMEATYGIRFRRPIFTRDDCVWGPAHSESTKRGGLMYVKSMETIWPRIVKSLVGDYPALRNDEVCDRVFDNGLMFVDNTPFVLMDSHERQLVCPSYEYEEYLDALEGIPPTILNDPMVKEYIKAQQIVSPIQTTLDDPMEALVQYHTHMASKALNALAINRKTNALNDDFWIVLLQRIQRRIKNKSGLVFDAKTIRALIPHKAIP